MGWAPLNLQNEIQLILLTDGPRGPRIPVGPGNPGPP